MKTVEHGRVARRKLGFVVAALVAAIGLAGCGPIFGVVTDDVSGTPLGGVSVQAYSTTSETLVAETVTGADGAYAFGSDLPDGEYRLSFGRSSWHGGTDWASADDVAVSADTPLNVDHAFSQVTGSISGEVSVGPGDFDLTPGNFKVRVENTRSGWSKEVISPWIPASYPWSYTVTGLPAGEYTIRAEFNHWTGDSYGNNKPWAFAQSAHVRGDGQVVAVPPGGNPSGVDVFISTDVFNLRVTVNDVEGLAARVFVFDEDGGYLAAVDQTPNHHRFLGLPRVPFRLLVVSTDGSFAPYFEGADATTPMGTLFPPTPDHVTIITP